MIVGIFPTRKDPSRLFIRLIGWVGGGQTRRVYHDDEVISSCRVAAQGRYDRYDSAKYAVPNPKGGVLVHYRIDSTLDGRVERLAPFFFQ